MEPRTLREIIRKSKLSEREICRRVGISPRNMRYYKSGEKKLPPDLIVEVITASGLIPLDD